MGLVFFRSVVRPMTYRSSSCPTSRCYTIFDFLITQVVNLETMRVLVPTIDVIDHSRGTAAPAFAVTNITTGVGSDYLFIGMGSSMLGIYSLATGQLVREYFLGAWQFPGGAGGMYASTPCSTDPFRSIPPLSYPLISPPPMFLVMWVEGKGAGACSFVPEASHSLVGSRCAGIWCYGQGPCSTKSCHILASLQLCNLPKLVWAQS